MIRFLLQCIIARANGKLALQSQFFLRAFPALTTHRMIAASTSALQYVAMSVMQTV